MKLSEQIRSDIHDYMMLNHPFYQDWMQGKLPVNGLRKYATEYKAFVDDFPRFVSRIHSQCQNAEARGVLIQNLLEEEGYPKNSSHPVLWRNFARGIGEDMESFEKGPKKAASAELVRYYWEMCDSSYEEGLAALYTYEFQIPEIAKAKREGLSRNYDIHSEETVEFFKVHEFADQWHSESCAELIDSVPEEKSLLMRRAAHGSASRLWNFLTDCY